MSIGSPDNEERRLLAEYETTASFYSWTVRELSQQREALTHEQYDRLQNMTENARFECERARADLEAFRRPSEDSK